MGRVTRAAARADPVLADETSTVAEIALSEDPENIELPPSAAKVSERPPLGEIRSNEQGSAAAASPLQLADPQDDSGSIAASAEDTSASDSENRVVLVLGADKKATVKGKKGLTAGTGKKSTKKAKGPTNGPSPEVMEQLRQTLAENTKTFKGRASKKGTKKGSNDKKIVEDDEIVSQSDASSEAAEMLMQKMSPKNTPQNENADAMPSPAVLATRKQLAKEAAIETELEPSMKLAVIKEPPPYRKSAVSAMSNTNSEDENAPGAVQKLAKLFQPQPNSPEKQKARSTLANIVSGELGANATTASGGIEALDALEEDIEAVEKSLPVVEKKTSPAKVAKPKTTEDSKSAQKSTSVGAANATRLSGTTARKTLSQTISPTDLALQRKKRTIEALNTPEKPKKSNKPPTMSTFQLSSEATAAKLKAQREERQKRREEEEQKQKELKTKPVANRAKLVEVRPTATSKARMSLAAGKPKEGEATGNTTAKVFSRASTIGIIKGAANTRRASTVAARPSMASSKPHTPATVARQKPLPQRVVALNTVAKAPRLSTLARSSRPTNSSPEKKSPVGTAARTPRPSINKTTAKRNSLYPRVGQATGTTKNAPAPETILKTTNTVKGKEVFNRDKLEKEERERVQKEKMDAATKARLEAAERGRAASKAWAERKKKTNEASKSRSTSGETEAAELAATEPEQSDENKENKPMNNCMTDDKPQASNEETKGGMAIKILQNGEMSQNDAAYIVAEMERIDEARQRTSVQGITTLS